MDDNRFYKLVKFIDKLDTNHKAQLYAILQEQVDSNNLDQQEVMNELKETIFNKGLICPYCNAEESVRYGKYKGRQRYKCKYCEKTFNDFIQTPFYRTKHLEKWLLFIECMFEGRPLRATANIVGLTLVTVFYWQHKILNALKQDEIDDFEGIVEIDETYFLYSEKGKKQVTRKPRKRGGKSKYRGISKDQVCVVVARDRTKNTIAKVGCMGRIKKQMLDEVIGDYISQENIICTDKWRAYRTFCEEKGVKLYQLKPGDTGRVIKGIYHIQNVNSFHSQLKKFINKFKGISSKYLDNYLSWYNFLDSIGHENTINNIKEFLVRICLYQINDTYDSIRTSKFNSI